MTVNTKKINGKSVVIDNIENEIIIAKKVKNKKGLSKSNFSLIVLYAVISMIINMISTIIPDSTVIDKKILSTELLSYNVAFKLEIEEYEFKTSPVWLNPFPTIGWSFIAINPNTIWAERKFDSVIEDLLPFCSI